MNAYLDFWGQWLPPAVVLAVSLPLLLVRAARPYAEGFVVPALLLLFRKAALFMPAPGLLGTEDRVAFWSTGAVIFFLFVAEVVLIVAAMLRDDPTPAAAFAAAILLSCTFVIFIPISAFLMPVDGWAHVAVPFLSGAALVKLFLVHPLTLPLVSVVILAHAGLLLLRSLASRELNLLLVMVLLIASPVYIFTQPLPPTICKDFAVKESWPWDSAAEPKQFLLDSVHAWPGIAACGVNLDGLRDPTAFEPNCRIRVLVLSALGPAPEMGGPGAISAGSFLLAVAMVSRLQRTLSHKLARKRKPVRRKGAAS
jgi:hypothetical protein